MAKTLQPHEVKEVIGTFGPYVRVCEADPFGKPGFVAYTNFSEKGEQEKDEVIESVTNRLRQLFDENPTALVHLAVKSHPNHKQDQTREYLIQKTAVQPAPQLAGVPSLQLPNPDTMAALGLVHVSDMDRRIAEQMKRLAEEQKLELDRRMLERDKADFAKEMERKRMELRRALTRAKRKESDAGGLGSIAENLLGKFMGQMGGAPAQAAQPGLAGLNVKPIIPGQQAQTQATPPNVSPKLREVFNLIGQNATKGVFDDEYLDLLLQDLKDDLKDITQPQPQSNATDPATVSEDGDDD